LSIALVACDAGAGGEGPRVLELAHDTIQLEAGVSLIEVAVGRGADGEIEPAAVAAKTGDIVRFAATDHGGHAIVFDGPSLDAAARDYLERTAQLRGPPLITKDAAWVVTLEGAPPGDYPFRCTTHNATGRLTVAAR
jgi:plastocyanin